MNILLTGGGTGGHVIPNIALMPYLRERGANITYMGCRDSIEERLMKEMDVPFYAVTGVKLRRDRLLSNIAIPLKLMRGIREAKKIISELDIDVVFAKGGYVSLPACYAAKSLKIPVICHESDMTLGVANRLISRYASLTITSHKSTRARGNVLSIGNPIRDKMLRGNRMVAMANIHYDSTKPTLLVMGGSSGARGINDFVRDNIRPLTSRYNVVHITGKGNNDICYNRYTGIEFTDDIEHYMALADIVVSRSGAGAITELMALKKRCILVPLETKASRGDQLENALMLERQDKAVVLRECDLSMERFDEAVAHVNSIDVSKLDYDIHTNAKIVDAIFKVVQTTKKRKS